MKTPPPALAEVIAAWDAGARTRYDVAAALGIKPATAANRVSRARGDGYLPPLRRSDPRRPMVPQPLMRPISLDALRSRWPELRGPVLVTSHQVAIGIFVPLPPEPDADALTGGVPAGEAEAFGASSMAEARVLHDERRHQSKYTKGNA
jgi:hypothetical protein